MGHPEGCRVPRPAGEDARRAAAACLQGVEANSSRSAVEACRMRVEGVIASEGRKIVG